jgi:hypothetical protein
MKSCRINSSGTIKVNILHHAAPQIQDDFNYPTPPTQPLLPIFAFLYLWTLFCVYISIPFYAHTLLLALKLFITRRVVSSVFHEVVRRVLVTCTDSVISVTRSCSVLNSVLRSSGKTHLARVRPHYPSRWPSSSLPNPELISMGDRPRI